jgi:glycosyltransferase involved in cell wall biosynthesis
MGYRIVEVELSETIGGVGLEPEHSGVGLVCRWHGRLVGFIMYQARSGLSAPQVEALVEERLAFDILRMRAADAMSPHWPAPAPPSAVPLSIAICTKDRAQRLERLLVSLDRVVPTSRFKSLEILVIDNASVDDSTRKVAESHALVRYVREPLTGLDFARNAALHAASGDLLAYLDDDVVVDGHWLEGLYAAWSDCPDAGGYSGLVMPYKLETRAQIAFEYFGGFGRGFSRIHHRRLKFGNALFPVASGLVGAGCNMAFDRRLLLSIGGFDEALDTGAPLPGGGDLDIFYRVLRSGREIVYEPAYAVFHEHRQTLAQLRRQYWSWGLGFMAFLAKARRADRELKPMQDQTSRWWFKNQVGKLLSSLRHRRLQYALFSFAELRGGIQGLFGEYERSERRSQRIRDTNAEAGAAHAPGSP